MTKSKNINSEKVEKTYLLSYCETKKNRNTLEPNFTKLFVRQCLPHTFTNSKQTKTNRTLSKSMESTYRSKVCMYTLQDQYLDVNRIYLFFLSSIEKPQVSFRYYPINELRVYRLVLFRIITFLFLFYVGKIQKVEDKISFI